MNAFLIALSVASAPSVSVRVDGEGYLRFMRDARVVYAKEARLTVENNRLVAADGVEVLPRITVSSAATSLSISLEGDVSATISGQPTVVGKLVIAVFPASSSLEPKEGFLTSVLRPTLSNAGEGLAGVIRTGSNSKPVTTPNNNTNTNTKPAPDKVVNSAVATKVPTMTVSVRPESFVSTETFSLLDIAELNVPAELKEKIATIPIGDTPTIGSFRKIDISRIELRLRVGGVDPKQFKFECPASVIVRRADQTIEQDVFLEAARAYLSNQAGVPVEIEDLNPQPPLRIGVGKVDLVATRLSANGDRVQIPIEVRLDGQRFNTRSLSLRVVGLPPLPAVGSQVQIQAKSAGLKVSMSGKIVRTSGLNRVEVQTAEGVHLAGRVIGPALVEVIL